MAVVLDSGMFVHVEDTSVVAPGNHMSVVGRVVSG